MTDFSQKGVLVNTFAQRAIHHDGGEISYDRAKFGAEDVNERLAQKSEIGATLKADPSVFSPN